MKEDEILMKVNYEISREIVSTYQTEISDEKIKQICQTLQENDIDADKSFVEDFCNYGRWLARKDYHKTIWPYKDKPNLGVCVHEWLEEILFPDPSMNPNVILVAKTINNTEFIDSAVVEK